MASLNMDSCLWNAYSWSKAGPGKTRNTLGQSHPFCGKSSLCNSCWITCAISNWNKGTSENQLLSENSKLISVVASDFFCDYLSWRTIFVPSVCISHAFLVPQWSRRRTVRWLQKLIVYDIYPFVFSLSTPWTDICLTSTWANPPQLLSS